MIENVAISGRQDAVVYIVDDDQSLRTALEDLLESVGLPAKSFASTQEFLRSQRLDTPSCLVLDIRMPGMSGLDFQRDNGEMEHSHSNRFHYSPRRYSNVRTGYESWSRRIPDQAVS
jgi:response regulator RpfG family c-di-GMP phosphodiesterase